ncbi:MAG: STAS domain-containing protein [Prevotella sp.]|jgi:anti-anti-sigma factor|nr:STAS domain-containing protein [Prevotella sp.]
MKTTIQENEKVMVAVLEGRLDTAAAAETGKALAPLYEADGRDIIFDCNALEYISSSGLRLFLGVLKAAKPKGSQVIISGINDELRKVFALTGFTNLFTFQ